MIVKNISELCKKRAISISGLEKELKFGNSTIAKWGVCSPTVANLKLVADYFGVTIDELLKEE